MLVLFEFRILLGSLLFRISLPDGTVKEGKKWQTAPIDVAREISKSLAANALIAQVDGVLWDMSRPLEDDCELKLFTFESDEGRDTFWHSSAHILGQVDSPIYFHTLNLNSLISILTPFQLCCFSGFSRLRWSMVASFALDPVPLEERYV